MLSLEDLPPVHRGDASFNSLGFVCTISRSFPLSLILALCIQIFSAAIVPIYCNLDSASRFGLLSLSLTPHTMTHPIELFSLNGMIIDMLMNALHNPFSFFSPTSCSLSSGHSLHFLIRTLMNILT